MADKRVGILLFTDIEVLDFCGPFEVFSVTRRQQGDAASPFEIVTVAETDEPVRAFGGLRVIPDHSLETCPELDILVVPGGTGTRPLLYNDRILAWVQERSHEVELLTSVCTGSLVLGRAGLLDGRSATTHWAALDIMRQQLPQTTVVDDLHWVEDGHILTSAGISAGIDMALRVVARLYGEEVARRTARQMEYPYPENDRRRIEI